MEERMTLCNMVIEAGGKNGIVAADRTTYKYLEVVEVEQRPLCFSHFTVSLFMYVLAYIHARC